MKRIYEDRAYDTAWPQSYWRATAPVPRPREPLDAGLTVGTAIVGAGYAGLNAAMTLAEAGEEVALLDASQPGWGASGRNGGFVCIGGTKLSDDQIVARVGTGGAKDFRRFQIASIDHVDALIERNAIPARQGPHGEAYLAQSPETFAGLAAEAEAEARLYGEAPELLLAGDLAERGLSGPGFHGGLIGRRGFPVHPMIYVEALADLAEAAGARIFAATPVTALAAAGNGWRLVTPRGDVTARRVLIATNGYSSEDIPGWIAGRTLPAMSSVMVTRPLTQSELGTQGFTSPLMSCDLRKLLHYFRHLPDGRFLFGMRGGTSASAAAERATQDRVRQHFEALFPAWAGVETEYRWSGFVCLTGSLAPFAGPVPGNEGLFATFGCHGGGVALQSYAGAQIAKRMLGGKADLPALVSIPPRRFPFPAFRRVGLKLAYAGYARKDGALPAGAS